MGIPPYPIFQTHLENDSIHAMSQTQQNQPISIIGKSRVRILLGADRTSDNHPFTPNQSISQPSKIRKKVSLFLNSSIQTPPTKNILVQRMNHHRDHEMIKRALNSASIITPTRRRSS